MPVFLFVLSNTSRARLKFRVRKTNGGFAGLDLHFRIRSPL